MVMNSISHDELKALVHYDPETGVFTSLATRSRGGKNPPGTTLGWPNAGYLAMRIGGVQTYSHRWAWFYMTGEWPTHEVDHKNRVRTDNRWRNLRAATHKQNLENNGRAPGASGRRGVHEKGGRWVAAIFHRGRSVYLGTYDDLADATHVRAAAERLLFTHSGASTC